MIRRSPIVFNARPVRTRMHYDFEVVLMYDNESEKREDAPAVIDLSHMVKWDVQSKLLGSIKPFGQTIPEKPGECIFHADESFIFRLNKTQAGVWHVRTDESLEMPAIPPKENSYTDITDASALLAIVGPSVPSFIEKITNLDLMPPGKNTPFVIQGPILNIPCRIVVWKLATERSVVLFSFSRGYAQTMMEALLDSGSRQGVYFAGEEIFSGFLGR